MHGFAALYEQLDATRSTRAKVDLLAGYFGSAPAADAAWALHFLAGQRLKRLIAPTLLRRWVSEATGLAPVVVEECYAHVGDLAETIALLLDHADRPVARSTRGLAEWVQWLESLRGAPADAQRAELLAVWPTLARAECFLLNKLLTGALRVGVSRGLVLRALAQHSGLPLALLAQRLMGPWSATVGDYQALLAPGGDSPAPSQPYPFCLASPLDKPPESGEIGPASDYLAEWKWDGIRGQLIRRAQSHWLWSRGEELLNGRFPEIEDAARALPEGTVIDGEILVQQGDQVLPFAVLQQRIQRQRLSRRLLAEAPVVFRAYDLLEADGDDWRERPLQARRARLHALLTAAQQPALQLSTALPASDWPALAALRATARERGVEGLMLKRADAPYLAGRRRGAWWKWKLDPLSVDTVLVYAQAGHGRRANLYTDYTLAVWSRSADGERQLVPVAKAYSGLNDAELTAMDRWIRTHTTEKFGPVRQVIASADEGQVFEIAFEGIQASPRHKAGLALRFPRIARWRRDKPAREADTLESLRSLLPDAQAP